MGKTPGEIAAVLSECIPDEARVFLPAEEAAPFDPIRASHPDQDWILVGDRDQEESEPFDQGIDLVAAVSRDLGITSARIRQGIQKARMDAGAFRVWRVPLKGRERSVFCVNAFAANDPVSTQAVVEKTRAILINESDRVIGLLNLRRDRGDRTLQWIERLKPGMEPLFDRLVVIGDGTAYFRKKISDSEPVKNSGPERLMEWFADHTEGNEIVVGFGNMKGAGLELIRYWDRTGKPYAV
jgi:hypothetical protein